MAVYRSCDLWGFPKLYYVILQLYYVYLYIINNYSKFFMPELHAFTIPKKNSIMISRTHSKLLNMLYVGCPETVKQIWFSQLSCQLIIVSQLALPVRIVKINYCDFKILKNPVQHILAKQIALPVKIVNYYKCNFKILSEILSSQHVIQISTFSSEMQLQKAL